MTVAASSFGNYTLLRRLARGGMADIYLARAASGVTGVERLVVIKVVASRFAEDAGIATMLEDEARIASALQHPNIAQILDVGR